jgi:hypothetical protein
MPDSLVGWTIWAIHSTKGIGLQLQPNRLLIMRRFEKRTGIHGISLQDVPCVIVAIQLSDVHAATPLYASASCDAQASETAKDASHELKINLAECKIPLLVGRMHKPIAER